MFGGGSKSTVPNYGTNKTTESGDCFCEGGPEDTISGIRFSNVSDFHREPEFISCSSWDATVKVWQLSGSYKGIEAKGVGQTSMDA